MFRKSVAMKFYTVKFSGKHLWKLVAAAEISLYKNFFNSQKSIRFRVFCFVLFCFFVNTSEEITVNFVHGYIIIFWFKYFFSFSFLFCLFIYSLPEVPNTCCDFCQYYLKIDIKNRPKAFLKLNINFNNSIQECEKLFQLVKQLLQIILYIY